MDKFELMIADLEAEKLRLEKEVKKIGREILLIKLIMIFTAIFLSLYGYYFKNYNYIISYLIGVSGALLLQKYLKWRYK